MNTWIVWGRFNETTLTNKKAFYGKLYLEDISDEDYIHPQKAFEELKLENLGDYRDLYVQSDALLLADACEIFWNKCIEIIWTWSCSLFICTLG